MAIAHPHQLPVVVTKQLSRHARLNSDLEVNWRMGLVIRDSEGGEQVISVTVQQCFNVLKGADFRVDRKVGQWARSAGNLLAKPGHVIVLGHRAVGIRGVHVCVKQGSH